MKKPYSFRRKITAYSLYTLLAAFLIGGAIFLLSVWWIVGSYMEKDTTFFLEEIVSNMKEKTDYLENIIYSIRSNDKIMEGLQNASPDKNSKNLMFQEFHKEVPVFSKGNITNDGTPFLESVYLFDKEGAFSKVNYFSELYSEAEKSDRRMQRLYDEFTSRQEASLGFHWTIEGNYAYMAYPIYNDSMDAVGTLIYSLSVKALENIMGSASNYSESFWFLYDKSEKLLAEGSPFRFELYFSSVMNDYYDKPYERRIHNTAYLIHKKDIGLNLSISIGIPKNQAIFLIYDSIKIYILIFVLVGIISAVISSMIIYRFTKPIKEVAEKINLVKEGRYDTKLPNFNSIEFHEISTVFNSMTSRIHYLINEVYEKQILVKESELRFLQAQMNPHFMFNVLNTISLKAKMEHNDEIAKMITSFSSLVQASIYREDKEKVQIRQELSYVEYYLYLQGYRYEERLTYTIETKEECLLEYYIPKLCLQLIVENAVVHGIEAKIGKSTIQVKIYQQDGMIFLDTIDDGVGFDTPADKKEILLPLTSKEQNTEHNRIGLNNAYFIIKKSYGDNYGIFIKTEKNKGSTVSIHIPFDEGGSSDV